MNFWFTVKEGFKGFKRARLSTTITISSIILSHLLIAIFIVVALNINSFINQVRNKIELEAYLEAGLSNAQINNLKRQIQSIEGVASLEYISKEKAALRFEKEFGKKINEILESNPLPESIIIFIEDDFKKLSAVENIKDQLIKLREIEDIVYQQQLIALMDKYINVILITGFLTGIILIIITFALLYNTIRLTIYARKDIIEIMKLVGAKNSFIKRPFVIEGILQGFIGSTIAALMLLGFYSAFKSFNENILIKPYVYGLLLLSGILIGWISSSLSVAKHLDY